MKPSRPVRLAVRSEEAATALGVGEDFFRAQVAPELRAVRRGRVKLYAITEIERWLTENAALPLDSDSRS